MNQWWTDTIAPDENNVLSRTLSPTDQSITRRLMIGPVDGSAPC